MKNFIIGLLILFLTLACNLGNQTQTPAPQPSVELVSPTQTLALPSSLVDECKISAHAFTNVGFGMPNPSHKLPTVGNVKTIVLFADFNDAPASQTPELPLEEPPHGHRPE